MEYFAIAFAGISVVFCIATFVVNRKDKAEKDAKENNLSLINFRLDQLDKNVQRILDKLEQYDKEVDERIDKALKLHVEVYHEHKREE